MTAAAYAIDTKKIWPAQGEPASLLGRLGRCSLCNPFHGTHTNFPDKYLAILEFFHRKHLVAETTWTMNGTPCSNALILLLL